MLKTRIIRYALIVFLFLPLITFAETQEIKEYKVIKGDTLWDISKKELNDPFMWPRIWKENSWIANPHWIYPDQMIKIPLYLIQEEKRDEEVTPKSTEEVTLKSTEESQKPAIVAEQRYKGIKGIVLMDGSVIEGQILFMSADIVKIRTKDGNISSYSFIKEVQYFITE
jgi:LysM domain